MEANPIKHKFGIGTWSWGDKNWGYGTSYGEAELEGAFNAAMDHGATFFDSAEIYAMGLSEELLGRFMKKYAQSHPDAPKPYIATKFIPLPHKIFSSSLESAVRGSLSRLGVDSIDLYQVHGPAFSSRSVETWAEALADVYHKGLVKAVGVSNFNIDQVRRTHRVLAARGVPLTSNQIEFSLLRNNPAYNGHIDACRELGVQVIAYSPLAMGRLTGKYSASNPPPNARKFGDQPWEEIEPLIEAMKSIGERHGKNPLQVALNWCERKGTIPIGGAKTDRHVTEQVAAFGWELTPDEVAQLDKLSLSEKRGFFNVWQEKY
eukprot:TRINITY_DN1585_c0_g1_i2.p1 TRINITY_DN1585_c0_g1~~TRINITY_DN1585_c0_g1_i2.p1  ORF type:complete len:331 (+),score=61.14 TRINITY_DN1585_c0_g1_i2:37-993(+)